MPNAVRSAILLFGLVFAVTSEARPYPGRLGPCRNGGQRRAKV